LVFLLCSCGPPPLVPETLPARLSDPEFWKMINDFSEAGGYFPSDNFLSNESGYQSVIPALLKTVSRSGVYIGVGPEQNFTYIAALQPQVAFIIDIRRQNMLEHLFYKALMETSADRAEFLSRLFSRPGIASVANSTPQELFRDCKLRRPNAAFFETNIRNVLDFLERQKGFTLTMQDEDGIHRVAQAFFKSGPDLKYTFIDGYADSGPMPRYSDLMTESDDESRNWSFLASERQFQIVQEMHRRNLIIPIVGDFAGPKAIRAVAEFVRVHGSKVSVFYTSNVEQFLFEDSENWKRFYDNVAFLPADSTSTFIRYCLSGWRFGRTHTSLTSTIVSTLGAYRWGVQGYYEIVMLSRDDNPPARR
jgi:hypothetical protein